MPSKKGRRVASRQAELRNRARRRPGAPHLSEAQLRGPTEQAAGGVPEPEVETQPQKAVAASAAATPSASPRARREQQTISLQAGPGMRAEMLRIGIVAFVVAVMVVTLRFATTLGQ